MDFDRVVSSFLDEKYAVNDLKKELSSKLDIRVKEINSIELLEDELHIHMALVVTFNEGVILSSENLPEVTYDYITVNDKGQLTLVLVDEMI